MMSTMEAATWTVSVCWTSWAKTLSSVGQLHQAGEVAGRGVCDDLAPGEDDDAVADALDDFEHVRDVEDGFAFAGEQDEQVFEEAGGDGVEAGERLVEDEEVRDRAGARRR